MSSTIIIKNARLSFDKNLFDPSEPKDKKKVGKYSCNIIAQPNTEYFKMVDGKKLAIAEKDLNGILEEVLKAKFTKVPAKFENWVVRKNKEAVSTQSGDRFSGYEDDNGIYFSPSRYADQGLPAFVRRDGSQLNTTKENELAEARRLFYAGCLCAFKINVAAYEVKEDNITKRGVTSFLEAVQFLKDGERFGRGEATGEGFDAEEGEDEEEEI